MKRLIDWARQQKRRGKLKQAFRVYDFWRRKSREVRVWWWRNAPLAFYRLVVAVRPNWEDGHYALGKALQGRYIFLAGLKSGEAKRTAKVSWSEITDIGERAVAHVRKALSLDPDRLDMYEYLFGLLYFLGKTEEASIVLQQFEDLKSNLAEAGQENSLGFRFVPTGLATAIGRYTHLEYYVRASLLGWKPPHKIIMLLPDEASVSNPCFLDYWRRYITVISDSKTIEALSPLVEQLSDPMMSMTFNGQALFNSAALTMVQERWDAEKRPPLLTLSASDHERGWRCLTGLGVPEGAWFVCLHVREPGFRDGDSRDGSFRNADIDTYLPAIKTVVANGGWVIRMGDPSMKPLPAMDQVIDYVHSDVRSDWMDVFLCARCRFIIGTASGPNPISIAFGVPMVLTNYLPWNMLCFSSKDLFLPRLLWSLKEKRHLTFPEILSSALSAAFIQFQYDRFGVKISENTPEEINDIVLEMLMRLDGELTYSAPDERLQERFQSLTAECGTFPGTKDLTISCRMGKDFLRKYATLLDAPPQAVPPLEKQEDGRVDFVQI